MTEPHTRSPPLTARIDDILACVHCGFCLPACPTYELLGNENDSPRGRIYLMRAVAEGRLAPTDGAFALHIDQCLGCRACEPVCPSGVRYGKLLEHAREARASAGGLMDRAARAALRGLYANRWLQNLFWAALRFLRLTRLPLLIARSGRASSVPGRFRFAMAMLAATAPKQLESAKLAVGGRSSRSAKEASDQATPSRRERVAHLEGCVMEGLFRHVNRATARVVEASGAQWVPLPGGFCCGALHAHSGELERAREMARQLVELFEKSGAEVLLTNSAGCGAAMKDYPEWLRDDARYFERARRLAESTRDVSEWLHDREGPAYAALPIRVAYDAPCHLQHAQRIADSPVEVLSRIPELEVVLLPRHDRCCGAAGIYGLTRRQLSGRLLHRKLSEVDQAGPRVVVTGNPGCLMQIGAGMLVHRRKVQVIHPVELLDARLPV